MAKIGRLLVIADDYTGALDTGVQFSRKDVPALVLAKERFSFDDAECAGYDVLVVDTESRHMPPKKAYDVVRSIASQGMKAGMEYFYKKTDSALRGNIGAELAGLLDSDDFTCLTFVPAFPKSHRVTIDGVHYIDGVELAESVFAKDPFTPVKHNRVADIIRLQTNAPIENIPRGTYEKAGTGASTKTIRVLDAESMEDIVRLGAILKRGNNLRFLAGCAGFAEILPELLDLPKRNLELEKHSGNILIVSGSVNPITIEQISDGAKYDFSTFTLTAAQMLDFSYPESEECKNFVHGVKKTLEERKRVIVRTVEARKDVESTEARAREDGIPKGTLFGRIAGNIGAITLRILQETRVDNLAIFGGDTLHSVLAEMRCEGVCPIAELSPGVVASTALSKDHRQLVITKSGGLGKRDVLGTINAFVFGDAR
ncbi:MAG: four-carbon acid sugar kinase family protein [Synergistaceae bacterium]|jgi:uncharacterized protein YgbK (DUF1537 family)|nr:four-carbon acid sugar kinase family protein [Synergistaceae bacterium]